MPQFVVSRPAAADLADIYSCIAQDDQSAAARMLEELRSAMRRLAQHPGLAMCVTT